MKLSWTSIRISIAGAKLSHLVQKDKIWDHGSMTEQVRIIFNLVQKTKNNGNIESLKKYMTGSCFEKLEKNIAGSLPGENPVITELAIISVRPGKNNRSDMFTALIKGNHIQADNARYNTAEPSKKFSFKWSFVRQGEWWLLNTIN